MLAEISAGLGSLNAIVQIGKTILGAQQDVTVKLEIGKMLDGVLDAKTGLIAAAETIGNLREELRQTHLKLTALEDLSRYEYVHLDTGATVVRMREGLARSQIEAESHFCPKCFEDKTVRILQTEREDSYLRCNTCENVFLRDTRQDEAIERGRNPVTGY